MIVTEEILNKAMSAKGGWSAKQLRCIVSDYEYEGNARFPSKGWKLRIIGQNIDSEQIEQFLALRKKDKRDKTGNLFEQPKLTEYELRERQSWIDHDNELAEEDKFYQDAILCIDDQNHLDSIKAAG